MTMDANPVVESANPPENPFYVKWTGQFGGLSVVPCSSEQYACDVAESCRRNKFGTPSIMPTRRIVAPMAPAVQS
jgi:hypothetical protein